MPVEKYLEIDSTYRNRNLYPSPGSFIVDISQGSGKTQMNATDPVSDAYSDIIFKPSQLNQMIFKLVVASADVDQSFPGEIASSSNTTLVFIFSGDKGYFDTFGKQNNSFCGLVLISKQTDYTILRRILKSTFLNAKLLDNSFANFYFLIEIDQPIADTLLQTTTTFTVYNPTTITAPVPYIFIPGSVGIHNYYKNYIIYNRDKKNYASIISFNGTTHSAALTTIQDLNWEVNHVYELKKSLPIFTGELSAGHPSFANSVNLGVTVGPYLINSFLQAYTSLIPSIVLKITGIVGTYSNEFGNIVYTTNLLLMTSYTTFVIVDNLSINLDENFSYELLQFSYDNTHGFNYTGSMSSVTQPSAYELTLNSICLPNIPLSAGGNVWNYPFIYVELENVSSSSANSLNIMYSNNPNCNKAVFKVPIVNVTNPSEYQFLTFKGNGMCQTVTIKPNSDMKLTVRLPNGTVFTPFDSDTINGQAPDTQKQLSVLISFIKM